MARLVLNLKKEYFDQIARGEKLEEYRLCTAYWQKRLEGKSFKFIELRCGYPKRDDGSRMMARRWIGYTVKTIMHPHFGKKPVRVYAIDVRKAL